MMEALQDAAMVPKTDYEKACTGQVSASSYAIAEQRRNMPQAHIDLPKNDSEKVSLGQVSTYYYALEEQKRNMPHVHLALWRGKCAEVILILLSCLFLGFSCFECGRPGPC